jgi:hypothetical protein
MRALALFAAVVLCGSFSPAVAAGTADILPKPTERQQQVIDVMAKLNDLMVPTRAQFVYGSLSFVIYHELGHFLIDEYDIPVLTPREEDMADAYSTFEVAPYGKAEEVQAPVRLWLFYAYLHGTKPIAWWDEHSLDHQRAFEIACSLAGRWPERYAGLPEAFGASAKRTQRCARDSHRTQAAWVETLRAQNAVMIDKQKAVVTYLPAPPELADAEKWLSASGLLESVAIEIQRYKLPDWRIERRARLEKEWFEGRHKPSEFASTKQQVDVIAKSCGEANASYVPPSDGPGLFGIQPKGGQPQHPQIVVCYELVDEIRTLAENGLP